MVEPLTPTDESRRQPPGQGQPEAHSRFRQEEALTVLLPQTMSYMRLRRSYMYYIGPATMRLGKQAAPQSKRQNVVLIVALIDRRLLRMSAASGLHSGTARMKITKCQEGVLHLCCSITRT